MKILSIETSCDDTGIAIIDTKGNKNPSFDVLSNIVSSQTIHQKYGGVYPAMAKREHQRNLVPVLIDALKKAKLLTLEQAQISDFKNIEKILEREPELYKKMITFLKKYAKPDIDLISVTNGPGLEPCLWVGVNFAKALSSFWNIPIVPVNHIESHILVNLLDLPAQAGNPKIKFPAIALVVSGGHTQIILVNGIGKYKILGETRDDAAGECFDKCAKILGLGYPGGPIISKLAEGYTLNAKPYTLKLPRPMISTKDYDFSFSGLKTAVLYAWQKTPASAKISGVAGMAAEVQQAIIDVLIKKTMRAVKNFNAKSLILGGGVSANQELRKQFLNRVQGLGSRVKLFVPKPDLSTDNGLMVAVAGYFNKNKKISWKKLVADGNLRIK